MGWPLYTVVQHEIRTRRTRMAMAAIDGQEVFDKTDPNNPFD